MLPGAAEGDNGDSAVLEELEQLSEKGQRRVQSVYGGRWREIATLCRAEPALGRALDNERTVLSAEIALAVRVEKAQTLIDIVHRRLMVGLAADYDPALIDAIATVAAEEFGWSAEQQRAELEALREYDVRLQRYATVAAT